MTKKGKNPKKDAKTYPADQKTRSRRRRCFCSPKKKTEHKCDARKKSTTGLKLNKRCIADGCIPKGVKKMQTISSLLHHRALNFLYGMYRMYPSDALYSTPVVRLASKVCGL
jgi:hypothetical protein